MNNTLFSQRMQAQRKAVNGGKLHDGIYVSSDSESDTSSNKSGF